VCGTCRVEASGLEKFHLALLGAVKGCSAEGAGVVMHAATGEFDGFAVEQEAFVDGPSEGAHPECCLDPIDDLAGLKDFGYGSVERGRFGGPKRRVGQGDFMGGFSARARGNLKGRLLPGNGFALCREHGRAHRDVGGIGGVILHLCA
jgi:hypothetical protein